MANILGVQTLNDVWIVNTDTNPTLTGGVEAPKGSICLASDGSGVFYKNSITNTDWSSVSGLLITGEVQLDFGNESNKSSSTINIGINPLVSLLTSANIKTISFINIETTETSFDDFVLNGVYFNVQNIINNTSFDIVGTAINNASGIYNVKYIITIN